MLYFGDIEGLYQGMLYRKYRHSRPTNSPVHSEAQMEKWDCILVRVNHEVYEKLCLTFICTYSFSIQECNTLASALNVLSLEVSVYHADLHTRQRSVVQDA